MPVVPAVPGWSLPSVANARRTPLKLIYGGKYELGLVPASPVQETVSDRSVDAASAGPTWLDDVYLLVARGQIDDAVDVLFSNLDEMLLVGHFSRCNALLRVVDLKKLDTNLLVGLLSITLSAKALLPERADVVGRVEARLNELDPSRTARLLDGLR
jgi:hypothetical protein